MKGERNCSLSEEGRQEKQGTKKGIKEKVLIHKSLCQVSIRRETSRGPYNRKEGFRGEKKILK